MAMIVSDDIATPFVAECGVSDVYVGSRYCVRVYRDGRKVGEAERTGLAGVGISRPVYRLYPCWREWLPSDNLFVLEGGRFYEVNAWRSLQERAAA